ncbi:hypothetical protein AL036_05035 [Salipiger aestuarii]|uniref:Uncharacterized membrane protein YebE (DUF533 family) n=1 Tax=Salipiger aestuarii TaxID=568098 RepID=A0A327YKN4_9RHOB|nr:DUF533 domain-containing protein [Salipiger aestuarii]EIE52261.1 hypothetical protein C357_04537 [Citreicella sp. 357]KAA8609082.1 hypothetical protein AL036_05035 [Salipiger aestuarii]KAA8614282.1 hypothetical protein AL037_03625 [Salipiger aestuarii]KAB2542772.1 hypothetical protein AL035_05305 [Salipiger aestuarii]RAK20285.1 uncharacterized membrane protein YebE (DUF533 family) [Salipiger aestuarii]
MSLMKTMTKLALGYAAARGMDKLSKGQGLAGLLGGGAQLRASEPGAAQQAQAASAMSGALPGSPPGANPLQDMMAKMQQGGLGALFGQGGDQGAGQGGLQGGIAGLVALAGGAATMGGNGIGAMIDQTNDAATTPETENTARLMLRAMIQAAKADGHIDDAEKTRIVDTVGENATAEDRAAVQELLAAPLDPEALARDTPEPQRPQVYGAALLTITVDTGEEAEFLDRLGKAMALPETMVNQIHMQMGLQPLYR